MLTARRPLSAARLDVLCGGAPTHVGHCPFPRCKRTVGPYYSASLARDALREHVRWRHTSIAMVGTATDEMRGAL